jgi:hypothetical protein
VVNSFGLNIYDLLYHEKLVISEAALKEIEGLLGPKSGSAAPEESAPELQAEAAEPVETAKPKRPRKPKAEAPAAAAEQEATE